MAVIIVDGTDKVEAAEINKFVGTLGSGTLGLAVAACYFDGSSGNPTATNISGFSTSVTRSAAGTYALTFASNFSATPLGLPQSNSGGSGDYSCVLGAINSAGCTVYMLKAGVLSDEPSCMLFALGSRA